MASNTRHTFSRCGSGREAVAFSVMRALLLLGVVVMACSSVPDAPRSGEDGVAGEPSSGGGDGGAGMAGRSQAGAQSVARSGSSAVGGGAAGAATSLAGTVAVAGSGGRSGTAGAGGSVTARAGAGGGGTVEVLAGAGGDAGEPSITLGGAGGEADGGAGGDGPSEPACVCSTGPCCDGCHYLPPSHFCGEVIRSSECQSNGRIDHDYWNLFCSGTEAAQCSRWGAHTKFAGGECGSGLTCSGAAGAASCG